MRITKEKLKFLKDYVLVSDSSTVLGDKLKIVVEEGIVSYSLSNRNVFMITRISTDTKENFELLVQIKIFWDFLNTIGDTEELVITEKGINLGEDKNYTFESYNLDFPDVNNLLKKIEDISKDTNNVTFDFSEFDKLSVVNKFIGKDSLETVGLMGNKLLGTDRIQITYVDSVLNFKKNYFLNKSAVDLLLGQKGKESTVRITLTDGFYYFKIQDTICIFELRNFSVPDLFSESVVVKFNQKSKIVVSKADLYAALNRMSFFVYNNPSTRIFLTVKEDHILIENRDFNKSFEKVYLLEKNPKLQDVTFVLNNKNILVFLSNLQGKEIHLFINDDSTNRVTVRFEDESHQFKFVHVLLKED